MNKKVLVLGGFIGLAGLTAYNYYNGFKALQFAFYNIQFQGNELIVSLQVRNPSNWFVYPVPELFLNVYNKQGQYLGVVYSKELQYIRPGVSVIFAHSVLNIQTVIQSVAAMFTPGTNIELSLIGYATVGGRSIALNIPVSQSINF